MSDQKIFLTLEKGDKQIEIVKTYDSAFAREAFEEMDEAAKGVLGESLVIEGTLDNEGAPFTDDDLWHGLEEGAREDWNSFSYFVVREKCSSTDRPLFVSSDWPTAERFAKLQA